MNPIKPTFKTEIFSIVLVLATILSSFYFYSIFPDQVPTHWNFQGEVDDYSSRAVGAFLFPGIIFLMYLMLLFIPYIDSKKDRYAQFRKTYHIFKTLFVVYMSLLYFIISLNVIGYNISIEFSVLFLIGILMIVIGNYMGKIKSNWFMGIRTPWTLSSEEVWNKTHRLGGKFFIAGGLLMFLEHFVPVAYKMHLLVLIISILVIGPVGSSYYFYYKEQKNEKDNKSTK